MQSLNLVSNRALRLWVARTGDTHQMCSSTRNCFTFPFKYLYHTHCFNILMSDAQLIASSLNTSRMFYVAAARRCDQLLATCLGWLVRWPTLCVMIAAFIIFIYLIRFKSGHSLCIDTTAHCECENVSVLWLLWAPLLIHGCRLTAKIGNKKCSTQGSSRSSRGTL